jgi:peptide/nickel transport system substrate-binding protein
MARFGAFRLPFGVLLAVLSLTACSRQDAGSPKSDEKQIMADPGPPVQGDWVIARMGSDPDKLNPVTAQTADANWVSNNVISEGLLRMNNETLKLEPCLAESWEITPDQLTYTFHLRHGVKWHDGQSFTADDVKFTYDKLMDPKVDAAPNRSYFTTVKSCEVIDPYTVRFTASERYFKTLEAIGTIMVICPRHAFDHGDPDFNNNDFNRHPIGTGPYKFIRWDTGSQIVVERFDDYWGPKPNLKRLVFQIINEPYVAAQLVKKGQIDVFDGVSPILWERDLEGTKSMNHLHQYVYAYPAFSFIGFNLRQDIFKDVRVRHAVDLLIPRDKIIKQIALGKYATKTSGYDPPASRNYNQAVLPTPYDPAQAQQLLTDAGWKNDHGDGILYKDGKPLSFTLLYGSGGTNAEKEGELMQESLKRAGIDMQLSRLQFAQLVDKVNDWKYDAVMMGYTQDINGDPWQLWNSADADVKKSSNFVGYKNAQVDDLMKQGRLEYDDDKRAAIYRQVHQIIHDDYPMCFLTNPKVITVVDDRFEAVKTFAPVPCFDLTTWWVPRPLQKYGN